MTYARSARRRSALMVRRRSAQMAAVMAAFAVVSAVGLVGCGSDDGVQTAAAGNSVRADLEYDIPAGTGERIAAGETVEIVPATLRVKVGQVIRIVNHDDRTQVVGPFSVAPRSTLTQRFTAAGRLVGACTVHPSGRFEIIVSA